MNTKIVQTIVEYAHLLSQENLCKQNGDKICVRADDTKMYCTKDNVDFATLTENDVEEKLYSNGGCVPSKIFRAYPEIKVVLHTHPDNICAVAAAHLSIPAVLDDMAQIVGVNAKITDNQDEAIVKALKGRNSILVCDDGAINTGRTVNEAYTGCLVLEKSAKVFISGSVVGGCKIINTLEAKLMRLVYKKKYSKKNQQNLAEKEM